jgi:hypothetical protein
MRKGRNLIESFQSDVYTLIRHAFLLLLGLWRSVDSRASATVK